MNFLNRIFRLNLVSRGGASWNKNSANTSGTDFDSGPATLNAPSATDSIDASGITNGTYTSYYDNGSGLNDNSVLGKIQYGSGYIYFVGFDYFGAGFATDWGSGSHVDGGQRSSDYVTFALPAMLSSAAAALSPSAPAPSGGDSDPAPAPRPAVDTTPADPAPAGTNIQTTDADGDGLREVITASDGSTVDGNRDGIPDVQQSEVAGLRLINDGAVGSDYGALVVSPDVRLSAVTLTTPATDGTIPVTARGGGTVVATSPEGITNAFAGVVSFNVGGLTPGGTTEATITFPSGLPADSGNAYVRFNYSTNRFEEYVDAAGNPLYSFVDSDGNGVFDAVKLTLVDGDPNWDGDGAANGTVVDPGFLAVGEHEFSGTKRKDTLTGNLLANKINGKASNDWLQGGLGADVLVGGKGKDRYAYTNAEESTASQRDTVRLGKGDRFVFSTFDGVLTTDGQQKLTFIGRKSFSGAAGELRATRSVLEADLNGDRLADFAVNLRGNTLIGNSNLVL